LVARERDASEDSAGWEGLRQILESSLNTVQHLQDQASARARRVRRVEGASDDEEDVEELDPAEASLVRAQAVVRGFLARRRWTNVLRDRRRRAAAGREIVTSEASYVASLHSLIKVFVTPLRRAVAERGAELRLGPRDVQALFANVDAIVAVHEDLLEALQARVPGGVFDPDRTCVGDIFAERAPFFAMYSEYIDNYDVALARLVHLRNTNTFFASWLAAAHSHPETGSHDIMSFLIAPVQRIPRYVMLLGALLKLSGPEHPDYARLTEAHAAVCQIADRINESKRKAEQRTRLIALVRTINEQQFAQRLVAPHRLVVREGTFAVPDRQDLRPRLVCLCNDILVVCRERAHGPLGLAASVVGADLTYGDRTLRLRLVVRLSRCQASVGADGRTLVLHYGEGLLRNAHLTATDEAMAREWQGAIEDACTARRVELKQLVERTTTDVLGEDEDLEFDARDLLAPATASLGGGTAGSGIDRRSSMHAAARTSSSLGMRRPKVGDIISMYLELLDLHETLFELPIDLATLLPHQVKRMPPDFHAMVRQRLDALRATLGHFDSSRDRLLAVLQRERVAADMVLSLRSGRDTMNELHDALASARGAAPPSTVQAAGRVVDWFVELCALWDRVMVEDAL
jgi:hypothetical protein